jgi:transposase
MIERSVELPDDVDQLKALALEALARADRFEAEARVKKTDAQALRRRL